MRKVFVVVQLYRFYIGCQKITNPMVNGLWSKVGDFMFRNELVPLGLPY